MTEFYLANHAHRSMDGNQCTNVCGLALATISSKQYCIYQSRRIEEPYMHYEYGFGLVFVRPAVIFKLGQVYFLLFLF